MATLTPDMGTLSPEAAAAAAAAAAAQLQFALTQVAEPVLIASFVSCSLYGVLLYLIITYFVRFRTDRLVFLLLLGFYLLSATADTAIECSWAYGYTISAFSDPTVYTAIPWPYIGYAVLGPNVLLAQGFYTWRVWIISSKKAWPLASIMLLIQVAACCLAFYLTHWAATADSILSFQDIKPVMYAWLGCGLLCDILITSAITWYLMLKPRRERAGVAMRDGVLRQIVVKSFQTNALSLTIQLAVLLTIVMSSETMWYTVPGFQESKIYMLSVVLTLNARSMSASGDQHDFTSADMSRSKIAARSTGFSASTTGAYPPTQSLRVHVREEVKVEEETDEKGDFPSSSSMLASSSPYSVRFDRAKTAFDEIELGKTARY